MTVLACDKKTSAYISNIQHFCVHDGNGFRTTVFLQGCPLRCAWCQNPELQSYKPVHIYRASECNGCLACVEACVYGNLNVGTNSFRCMDERLCRECLADTEHGYAPCEEECYFHARQLSSHPMSVREVFSECLKESMFYQDKQFDGGITLSGGEPLSHFEFCMEMARLCYDYDVSLAVETSGYVGWETIRQIAPYVDIFLYDLKVISENKRRRYIGAEETFDLNNLIMLAKIHHHIVIRIPLVPGVNDDEAEFGKIIEFTKTIMMLKDIQILPFHQLGAGKYDMAGLNYTMKDIGEDNHENVIRCVAMAKEAGFNVGIGGADFT